jgi:flagellar basal body-associated protein FliL
LAGVLLGELGNRIASLLGMEAANHEAPKREPAGRKWLVTAVATAVVLAGCLFFYTRIVPKTSSPEVRKPYSVVHLEPFVVNLADDGQQTFLRIGIDLAVEGSEIEKKCSSLPLQAAPLRDTLLEILSASRSEELVTAEGKQKLKESILQRLNRRLPETCVREVYFTDFLVQK